MANNPKLHVIWGTGPLGMAVMRALTAKGETVRMVNRSGKANGLPNVSVVAADAYNLDSAREACQGATVVYQCAKPPHHEWPQKFPPLQANILEATARAAAKLIVGENLYMYGEVPNRPLTEDLPIAATTRKGRTRAQMTEAALAAHRNGKVQVAVGRGSDFFGPGVVESAMGERAFLPALQGKAASLVGNIDLPHTYTFINDFGEALATLGERDEALGQVWHVPNAETLTTRQFMTIVFEEIGKPPKMSGMGKLMMRIGGIFIVGARETVEMMYEFEKPFIVDSSKFERTFGERATPHREAIRQTIEWYRAHYAIRA
jgi:nucleoside-diphosphate-sugar epimerase